jgi:serine/threonine-protein kinase
MSEPRDGPEGERRAPGTTRVARAPEDLARDRARAESPEGGQPGEIRLAPPEERPQDADAPPVVDSFDPNVVELPTEPPPRRHRVAASFSMLGLAIAAFATGLFVFNNLVMPRLIHVSAEVRVPDLTNLTLSQAEREVSALGLQLSRAGERFDPSVPTGFILSQDPREGTPVRGRRRVMVVVSLGEEFSSVPELFGESTRGAGLLVERAGLSSGGVTRAASEEVGEGLVVASDPPAGSVLPRATAVGLLISLGAGREEYVMPELLGRQIGGVRRQLEALGLRVNVPAGAPAMGGIVYQDPAPGSRITRDATVTLRAMGRLIR